MKGRRTSRAVGASAILAIFMLFWAAVSDSADPIPVLGLKESIDLALQRSVVVESSREGVRITQAQNAEAFTGFLPSSILLMGIHASARSPLSHCLHSHH